MIKLSNPFKLSIFLLLVSILISLLLSFKTLSLWATSVVLLTFSRGIIILFSYSSSLITLDTKIEKPSPLIAYGCCVFLGGYFHMRDPQIPINSSIKLFSSNQTTLLVIVVLCFFIIPILDNCFSPEGPVQSSF